MPWDEAIQENRNTTTGDMKGKAKESIIAVFI